MGKFPGFGNLWVGDFFYWKYMGNFVGKFLIITPNPFPCSKKLLSWISVRRPLS